MVKTSPKLIVSSRPIPHRTTTTSPPSPLREFSSTSVHSPSNNRSLSLLQRHSLPQRPFSKGLSYEQLENTGMISADEGSADFDNLPVSPEELKQLPRKLRGYYEHLALLRDHYLEVEGLLSGELPSTIARSFQNQPRTYTQAHDDLFEQVATPGHPPGSPTRRRSSAWRMQIHGKGKAKASSNGDAEAGEHTPLNGAEREERRDRIARLALNVNTIVNIVLVIAKAFAVLYSSSISLTASLVDSALDLLSTFIILGTSWAIGLSTDRHKYPAGKRRFEPLGVLIFSVAMIASFVQVFIESFQRVLDQTDGELVYLSRIGVGTMLATIGVKLILWIWCSRIPSSGVQALAQDAENDVWFNIMSLAFPFIGSKVHWRLLDPIGGMVLSAYIIIEWLKTLLQNFANLSGRVASADQLTRVLYLVTRFNPVLEIGDVECYHIGDDLIVEIDVILPQSSTLHFAHDVGETIQCVLESLDGVLRAYVHCDYSSANPQQHTSRLAGPPPANIPPRSSDNNDTSTSSGSATPRPPRYLGADSGFGDDQAVSPGDTSVMSNAALPVPGYSGHALNEGGRPEMCR